MSEREEFEKWARSVSDNYFPDFSPEGDGYWQKRTDTAWKAWQACAELKDKEALKNLRLLEDVPLEYGSRVDMLRTERERNLESIRQGNDIINRLQSELDSALAQLASYKDILVEASAAIDELEALNSVMHYPECWDTAAYPDVISAVTEMAVCSECNYIDSVGYASDTFAGHGSVWDGSRTVYPAVLTKNIPSGALLYARPVPAISEGMVLVPVEPTSQMIQAFALQFSVLDQRRTWMLGYRAMIAAAQKGGV